MSKYDTYLIFPYISNVCFFSLFHGSVPKCSPAAGAEAGLERGAVERW